MITTYEDIEEFRKKSRRKSILSISMTLVLLVISFMLCMCIGNYTISPQEVLEAGHEAREPRVGMCQWPHGQESGAQEPPPNQ